MPNWVNAYATVTGDRKKVEEFMTFFLDNMKDNRDRKEGTYFYRSFLADFVNDETDEKDIRSIDFGFYTAWEMTNNLTGENRGHNCANLFEQAKRLKLDVKIEGEEDTKAFRQTIVVNAFSEDKPTIIKGYVESKDYECPNCGETDAFFKDEEKRCYECNTEMKGVE